MSTFDPTRFGQTFIANLHARREEPEAVSRSESLHKVLTSITYGYFQLWYNVAKDIAFQQAASDRVLDGAVQVVVEDGKLRLYEGRESEPEGVFPVLRPYKKPGTENLRDREGNLVTRSEFDNDVLWVGLYQPLWRTLKEQFDLSHREKLQSLNAMFLEHGIKGTVGQLEFLINELLDEAITLFGDATMRGVRVIDRAKRVGETFEDLSPEDKRMRMRGLLITLNEEALERRRNRRDKTPEKRADTVAGQVYRSQQSRNSSSPQPPVKRAQVTQPQGNSQGNGSRPPVPAAPSNRGGVSAAFLKPYGGAGTGAPGAAPGSAPGAIPPGSSQVSPDGALTPSRDAMPGIALITGVREFDPSLLSSLPPEELDSIPQGGVSFYGSLAELQKMEEEGLVY